MNVDDGTEESEQEDGVQGGEPDDGEEEDIQTQRVKTKEAMAAESDKDEDDAALLRVMKRRRLPRPLSEEIFPQTASTNDVRLKLTRCGFK